jgi:hypothetical protein
MFSTSKLWYILNFMTFRNLSVKDIFILLFAPVLFLSDFVVTGMLQNIKEFSFVNLTRPLFIVLILLVALYAITLTTVIEKLLPQRSLWVKRLITFLLVALSAYYVSTFMHPIGEGIYFLNILAMSLGINIILCFLISKIVSSRLEKDLPCYSKSYGDIE